MAKKSTDLPAQYLKKAHEKLSSAVILLREERFEDSTSRSYYAAFLAATAALSAYGLHAETHRGVATLFGMTFLKTGKMKKSLGKLLANLREDRESGDYEAYSWVDESIAENALAEAQEFVREVSSFLGIRSSRTKDL